MPRPSFDEARAIVVAATRATRTVQVPLADTLGRVTALPVEAVRDYPAYEASAMDGFAFSADATKSAVPDRSILLPIAGESRAGGVLPIANAGSACAISTGAMMPPGCDTVIARERAMVVEKSKQNFLRFDSPEPAGRNVRHRGEDMHAGTPVLPPGTVISAEKIGALGCFGLTALPVFAQPRIAIIPTGDELIDALVPSGIVDANGPMIAAAAKALGLSVIRKAPVADSARSIEEALQSVLLSRSADILLSTGGVSAGDHDHVSAALRAIGATIHFHGIRMRPGKPLLFATFPCGTVFFGLPGNPVAALVGFRFLVTAAIRAMAGRILEAGTPVVIDTAGREGTTLFLKARQSAGGIEILPGQQSHRMRPLLEANCWLAVDRNERDGTLVRHFPLSASME